MIEQAIGNLSGIFWIFLLVIPLLLLKALLQNPKVKGRIGERAVRSVIGKDLDEETYIEFHDLIIRQAASYIRRFQTTLLLPQEIEAATAVLSSNEYQADDEKLQAHTKRLQERHQR